jgi:hypothetical protein
MCIGKSLYRNDKKKMILPFWFLLCNLLLNRTVYRKKLCLVLFNSLIYAFHKCDKFYNVNVFIDHFKS